MGSGVGSPGVGGGGDLRASLDGSGKILLLPGFEPRTVLPVASPYIDYVIEADFFIRCR